MAQMRLSKGNVTIHMLYQQITQKPILNWQQHTLTKRSFLADVEQLFSTFHIFVRDVFCLAFNENIPGRRNVIARERERESCFNFLSGERRKHNVVVLISC